MRFPFISDADPDAIAWTEPHQQPLTFRDLVRRSESLYQSLADSNLPDGAIIAAIAPTPLDLVTAFFAVSNRWAFAPLGPGVPPDELTRVLSNLNPCGVLDADLHLRFHGDGFAVPGSLCLMTSATTGRSKFVARTTAQLTVSAFDTKRAFALSSRDRFLCVMPMHHLQALGSAFAQWLAGGGVACVPGFNAADFPDWLHELKPTWFSASPTIHEAVSRIESPMPRCFRFIHSVGAPLAASALARLERRFDAPVIESYGLTETGIVTSNPLPPGVRKPGCAGLPVGPEVRLADDEEILVRGPSLFNGYLNEDNSSYDHEGWFHTGDLGQFDSDGYLRVNGRIKEIINRGGDKIIPDELDRVIESHPAVCEAAVFSLPHPTLGEDIAAAVVLVPDALVTESQLAEFCRSRVARERCPRHFLFVDSIPRGETGKPLRRLLRLPAPVLANEESAPPRLRELWSRVLGLPLAGGANDFYSQGGDSLRAATLLIAVSNEFGIPLESLDPFLDDPTLERLSSLLRESPADSTSRSRLTYFPNASGSPLFLVASAAEHAFALRPLVQAMGPARTIIVLLTSGHVQDRGPGHLAACAVRTVEEMRRIHPCGPYTIAGYCYGGIVAARAAALLHGEGAVVRRLLLIDAPCPGPNRLHRRWHLVEPFVPLPARREPIDTEPLPVHADVHQILAAGPRVSSLVLEDPRLSWRRFTVGRFVTHTVAGSHDTLLSAQAADSVAAILRPLTFP